MGTPISEFRAYVRHALGDQASTEDGHVPRYEDAALDQGVQYVVRMGRVPGYALAQDGAAVEPAVTDPNKFALLILYTALSFVMPWPDRESVKTRAITYSRSTGAGRLIQKLEDEIAALEDGRNQFTSWAQFERTWE